MTKVTGAHLRAWRQWAGWDVPETARQLRRAAGDDLHIADHTTLMHQIRKREREDSGVSERHVLLYARALGVTPAQLGDGPPQVPERVWLSGVLAAVSGRPVFQIPAANSNGGWVDIGELVMAAADESGERAAADGGQAVSPSSVDQVLADVQRLARSYSAVPPLAFLAETRRVRDRASQMAGRTRRPGQIADLYVAAGQACALMAVASFDLAVWPAAVEQAYAALQYGEASDYRGLQAWARGMQGLIAYWCGRPQEAVRLVTGGLPSAAPGTARARLHSISARAWSHLGAADRTRAALAAADSERDLAGGGGTDEMHDRIGGEFGWGPARHQMSAATALLRISDADGAAARAAEAIRLHAADRSGSLVDMTARADLACAELARGRLDAAGEALGPVWRLAPEHRRYSLVKRLESVAGVLAGPRYGKARAAVALAERISVFTADSAPALPTGLKPPGPVSQ